MLVLTRKRGERVTLSGGPLGDKRIDIFVTDVRDGRARLGFEADPEIIIRRDDIKRTTKEGDDEQS